MLHYAGPEPLVEYADPVVSVVVDVRESELRRLRLERNHGILRADPYPDRPDLGLQEQVAFRVLASSETPPEWKREKMASRDLGDVVPRAVHEVAIAEREDARAEAAHYLALADRHCTEVAALRAALAPFAQMPISNSDRDADRIGVKFRVADFRRAKEAFATSEDPLLRTPTQGRDMTRALFPLNRGEPEGRDG